MKVISDIKQQTRFEEHKIRGSINDIPFSEGLLNLKVGESKTDGSDKATWMLSSCTMKAKIVGDLSLCSLLSNWNKNFELIAITEQGETISFNVFCVSSNTQIDKDSSMVCVADLVSYGLPKGKTQISIA